MRRFGIKIFYLFLTLFLLVNIPAAFHAYKFTHFSGTGKRKTRNPDKLSFTQKLSTLIVGVDNPRPEDDSFPKLKYEEVKLKDDNGMISCWMIPKENSKGTIILFHGYAACKSKMLQEAESFDSLGYQTILVDFEGSGESSGNRTTIGYYEARDVLAAYNFANKISNNVILYGTSMGASSILRAVSVYKILPAKIILNCPYGSMLTAAENRFAIMGVPPFPFAYLLVFWGGLENGYWAFPGLFALCSRLNCPTLLMRGKEDKYVSEKETMDIFKNLSGSKRLYQFDNMGHESYCAKNHDKWVSEISNFLNE